MIYKTLKILTDWEFERMYNNDDVNIDTELQLEFKSDYPNHTISAKLGYLTNNNDGTKTYDLTIIYELTRLL